MPLDISRRCFCSATVGVALTSGRASAAKADRRIIVNALGSLYDPNTSDESFNLTARVLKDAFASGLTAVNISLGWPSGGFEATVRNIAAVDRVLRDHEADTLKVLRAADIERAKAQRKIGIVYGLQQLEMIGSDAARIDIFADLGVRVFQLTYNSANRVGPGASATADGGLTPFGHEGVSRLNDRRVMVDLSHSGEQTCLDAIRASRMPVSINHTGCRSLVDLPRNKTDEELRLVSGNGGFVGIYFMPFVANSGQAKAEDVVAHIDHAVNVCGEGHVGIGTDGPITRIDDLQAFTVRLAKEIAARKAAGISGKGENAHTLPFVADLCGTEEIRRLIGLLRSRGYSSSTIEKMLGLNFVRFAEAVWA